MLKSLSTIEAALVLTAIECVGDVAAKMDGALLPTFASYNALAYTLTQVLPNQNLAIINGYWNAATNLTHVALGAYFFGESVTQQQFLGLMLISGGILLLNGSNYS